MDNIPCRYFQSSAGCRFGDQCRFSHSAASSVASCRFYASVAGCRYGSGCYYKHDVKGPSPSKPINDSNNKSVETIPSKSVAPKPDIEDELIIFGYIRELMVMATANDEDEEDKDNKISIESLSKLCVKFYSIIIGWDVDRKWHNSNMSIIDNGNCIKMNNKMFGGNKWGSAFLRESFFCGFHHFKFKIESLDSRRKFYVLFGIWKIKSGEPILNSFFTDKKNNGYAINIIDGTLTDPAMPGCGGIKYAKYCKNGDIIEMFLDFNKLLLSFAINGKYYDQNPQKIEKTKYKVAITMYWENDQIRFISHDTKPFNNNNNDQTINQ